MARKGKINKGKAVDLYLKGMSFADLAIKFKVSETGMRKSIGKLVKAPRILEMREKPDKYTELSLKTAKTNAMQVLEAQAEKIPEANLSQLSGTLRDLHNFIRLEEGKSTSNTTLLTPDNKTAFADIIDIDHQPDNHHNHQDNHQDNYQEV